MSYYGNSYHLSITEKNFFFQKIIDNLLKFYYTKDS